MLTERLEIRPPTEADRDRFVELFGDQEFMAFWGGVMAPPEAHRRIDHLLALADELPFSKRPIVERSTGTVVGYIGVDRITLDGERHLELGYRLVADARGKGYATEAGRAILTVAAEAYQGVILAIIDPANRPSQNVARKLGFTFWKQQDLSGDLVDLHRLTVG